MVFSGQAALGIGGDELIYGPAAKRMLERDDWLTLYQVLPREFQAAGAFPGTLGDEARRYGDRESGTVPLWGKTPLAMWSMGASLAVFGDNEFALRLPSSLAAIGTVAITFALTHLLTGSTGAALWAGLVLITSQPFLVLAQSGTTDTIHILFSMVAVWAYFRALQGHRRTAILIGLGVGLAFFAKPFVSLLVLPILFLHALVSRNLTLLRNVFVWIGLVAGVAVNVLWFAYEYSLFGDAFLQTFWRDTLGIEAGMAQRLIYPDGFFFRNTPWYYIRDLLVFYLPWAIFVPVALRYLYREHPGVAWFAAIWTIVVLTCFSLSVTKFLRYIGMLYPVLAIVVGYYLMRVERGVIVGAAIIASALTLVVVRMAYLAYALQQGPTTVPLIPSGARWWIGLTVMLALATLLGRLPKRMPQLQVAAPMAAIYLTMLSVTGSYWVIDGAYLDGGNRGLDAAVRTYVKRDTAEIVGATDGPEPLNGAGLYWYLGGFRSAFDGTALKEMVRWPIRTTFIVADEGGAKMVHAAFPQAVIRRQFIAEDRRLYLFELEKPTAKQ
jgi:4-amino-4-deoxy-L-arabinose transferase-like glycosyltransferase